MLHSAQRLMSLSGTRGRCRMSGKDNVKNDVTAASQSSPRRQRRESAATSQRVSPASSVSSGEGADTAEHYSMQYFCVPCKIKFSNPDTLQAHQQYYCPASKAMLEQAALLAATGELPKTTSGSPANQEYTCTKCVTSFASRAELMRHVCSQTTMKIPVFCCPYCDYVAQSDSRLLDHIKAHAPTKAYRCELCGYRGNTVRGMRMHGKTHVDAGQTFTDDHITEYKEAPLVPKRLRTVTENVQVSVASDLRHADIGNIHQRKRNRSGGYTHSAIDTVLNQSLQNVCVVCDVIFADCESLRHHMTLHVKKENGGVDESSRSPTRTSSVSPHNNTNSPPPSKRSTDYHIENILGRAKSDLILRRVNSDLVNEPMDCDDTSSDDCCKDVKKSTDIIDNNPELIDSRRGAEKSPKSSSPPLTSEQQRTRSPLTTSDDVTTKAAVNYCTQCDIPFVYLSTYVAHKKYYCSSHAGERDISTPAEI